MISERLAAAVSLGGAQQSVHLTRADGQVLIATMGAIAVAALFVAARIVKPRNQKQ